MLLNNNYFFFLIYFFLTIILVLFLFILSFAFFSKKKIKTKKKKSLYECGFETFSDGNHIIDIQYICVALIFIIFDLEILFILPWIISANYIGNIGCFSIYVILNFFLYGLIYEISIGSLDWNKK